MRSSPRSLRPMAACSRTRMIRRSPSRASPSPARCSRRCATLPPRSRRSPPSPLTTPQTDALFTTIFKTDGSLQPNANDPALTIQGLALAGPMLSALRNSSAALTALAALTGQTIPATGPLTSAQTDALFTTIFKTDGSLQPNANNPALTIQGVAHAGPMLSALRNSSAALTALAALTGQTIPATGQLTSAQTDALFTTIFKTDGSLQPNANNPALTIQGVAHAGPMLSALRNSSAALTALAALTGQTIPATGQLTSAQTDALFTTIFKTDGS